MDWNREVATRKDALIQDLVQFLKIESVKDVTESKEGKPMGERIAEALEFMLKRSSDEGLSTKNIEGYAGYAELKSSGPEQTHIGVLCHVDVVPATGNWTTPPFEPAIRDGKLYARGAIDDKGPTIAAFYALKIIKELQLPLKHNVRLIFGTDEESGMSCMKRYFEHETMPVAGFAPDADFPIIHAEKGQINPTLGIDTTADETVPLQLDTFRSGNKVNMVPETAKARIIGETSQILHQFEFFCSEHNLSGKSTINEEGATLLLFGKSAHGMEPEEGINAGLALAHFLSTYSFQSSANDYLQFIDRFLYNDYFGAHLGIHHTDDITGPLTVNAGVFHFVANERATLQLNIRCPVTTPYDKTKSTLLQKAAECGFSIDEIREKPPHHVDRNHPMIQVLQNVYHEETSEESTLLTTGGATYARFMEYGVAFGAAFPGKEMTAHQVDEYIEIDDLLKATAIYARAIYELGNLQFDDENE